ncbi:hypothetical protein D0817_18675 [Flavobacterium cupreum]|uniref:Uncharacterized protein n=1 Tax=Flavobacterium cupreum TaxID=2133766 RepID=A0A434A3F2_9FLAO|nr:hypothetical protein D0817_18675 [Flavobacterium cupreum]
MKDKKSFLNFIKKNELNVCLLKKNCKFAHSKIIKFLNKKEYYWFTPFSNHEKASKRRFSKQ